ncbi:MAG: CoA transferase [Deltaproteobacteria bacterium]|nr:CoA transferase [Deltaproteobacteria bacterium]
MSASRLDPLASEPGADTEKTCPDRGLKTEDRELRSDRPLSGIRVLDLSRMLTGDYAGMLLGDMGADVIKIEEIDGGDPLRKMPPHFVCGESAYFLSINRNKRSVTLNLKHADGRKVFHELVRHADVVFDNFRPGVLEKLGADWKTLSQLNPRIISCTISSFGEVGPYRELPAFDLTIQALAGAMSVTGEPGRVPVRLGIPMGDLAGSMFAVYSISAALVERQRTGTGRRIEVALLDCLISMLNYMAQYYFTGGQVSGPIGSGHMSVVPYGAFATKDRPITVAIFVEKFWHSLCEVVGLPGMADDPRFHDAAARLKNRDECNRLLQEKFLEKTQDEWIKALWAKEIPSAPILSLDQVFEDPQVLAREMVVNVEHPRCGTLKMVGDPVKLTPKPAPGISPPPMLGQHTAEVLRGLLGYDDARIAELKSKGVVS